MTLLFYVKTSRQPSTAKTGGSQMEENGIKETLKRPFVCIN